MYKNVYIGGEAADVGAGVSGGTLPAAWPDASADVLAGAAVGLPGLIDLGSDPSSLSSLLLLSGSALATETLLLRFLVLAVERSCAISA